MRSKLPLKKNIRDYLGIYLLAILVAPVVLGYSIILKTNPKPIERFTVFVGGTYKDEKGLKDDLLKTLPQDLAIYTNYCEENDSAFLTLLTSRGYTSDILLLTKDAIDRISDITFIDLTTNSKYASPINYVRDEKQYGIAMNLSSSTYFSQYVNMEESKDYYVCISSKSIHLEGFSSTYESNQVDKVLSRIYSL